MKTFLLAHPTNYKFQNFHIFIFQTFINSSTFTEIPAKLIWRYVIPFLTICDICMLF